MIERVQIDCDEDGFHLILYGEVEVERGADLIEDDQGVLVMRQPANLRLSQNAALQLHAEVRLKIEEWAVEGDEQRRNVERGLDHEGNPMGEFTDALLAGDYDAAERVREAADLERKRRKENP